VSRILIETSAAVELLVLGPEAERLFKIVRRADSVYTSAIARVEAGMVLLGSYGWRRADFDAGFDSLGAEIVGFDDVTGRLALDAFERYGRGRHKAKLNFGDCLSYAAAQRYGLKLLYIGGDFAATDVARA
jgi:ribonuclease VapC